MDKRQRLGQLVALIQESLAVAHKTGTLGCGRYDGAAQGSCASDRRRVDASGYTGSMRCARWRTSASARGDPARRTSSPARLVSLTPVTSPKGGQFVLPESGSPVRSAVSRLHPLRDKRSTLSNQSSATSRPGAPHGSQQSQRPRSGNGSVRRAATARKRPSSARCRAGRFWPVGARVAPRRS